MRSIVWIRNYAILVFFVMLVGGVLLQPGRSDDREPASAGPAASELGGVYHPSTRAA